MKEASHAKKADNHTHEVESSQWWNTVTYDLGDGSTLEVEEKTNDSNKNND